MLGYLRFRWHWFRTQQIFGYRSPLREAVNTEASRITSSYRSFTMIMGLSKSGKTTLTRNAAWLRNSYVIRTDLIRSWLHSHYPFLRDDGTITSPAYWARQYWTQEARWSELSYLFRQGGNVVSDSCYLNRRERQKVLLAAKSMGYSTTLVIVECDQVVRDARIAQADMELIAKGKNPYWHELYCRQKAHLQYPASWEADCVLSCNTTSHEMVISRMGVPSERCSELLTVTS
jgi:predicted kinase